MKLKNVYRGDIIKCQGYIGADPMVHTDSCGRQSYRYGKFDRIYKSNTVLIDDGDGSYIDLSGVNNSVLSNFENIKLLSIPTVATGDNCFYVDEGSLKPYSYSENNQYTKKHSR